MSLRERTKNKLRLIRGAVVLDAGNPSDLEEEANLLLYGRRKVIEEANETQIFRLLGGGAPKRVIVSYSTPKTSECCCADCGRPRAKGSAARCRQCYRESAQKKFAERSPWIEHWMNQFEAVFNDHDYLVARGERGEVELL